MGDETNSEPREQGVGPAVALAGASRGTADAYLDKQGRLADLQAQNLIEQNAFELSHLRFRRFSDWAKFALEVSVALLVLLILAGIATMVWNAVRDRDLVVDSFSVPADIAQSGMTGNVLAARVLDRFGAMDGDVPSFTQDFSSYRRTGAEDVRVEIPSTGVSIGELDRLLRRWLGHETHVTGELVHTPKGLAITVRYDGEPGVTAAGSADDLDSLIAKSAENMFEAVKPLRFADYLAAHGHPDQTLAIVRREVNRGDSAHRAAAYLSWAFADFWRGDNDGMRTHGVMAATLDPGNPVAQYVIVAAANNVDHEEAIYARSSTFLALAGRAADGETDAHMAGAMRQGVQAGVQEAQGDFPAALATCRPVSGGGGQGACNRLGFVGLHASLHEFDEAQLLVNIGSRDRPGEIPDFDGYFAKAQVDLMQGDIAGALARAREAESVTAKYPSAALDREVFLLPYEAEALARGGRIADARALIARTRTDCDVFARARGRIEMLARDWKGAESWFALVSARSIHVPFPDTDWGQMLLAKGDLDGAIARFAIAHAKGPHFADPLEMWGEALIAKNRSDLALAKFDEANRYAPHWGRLHLKWGEALLWSGDKDGARKQFAIAASLFLTPSEQTELSRVGAFHG